jgi:hypothetical protein
MPRNSEDVPRNALAPHLSEDGGKKRSERLRARREEAGLAQVSGWVPKDRRAYAREVLAAVSQGSNSLPPAPEQAAALEAAQAAVAAARIAETAACEALVVAQQHGRVLAAELDATRAELAVARTEIEAVQDAGRQAETTALAQVEAADAKAALALATAERFQKAPGLRGRAIRWLAR